MMLAFRAFALGGIGVLLCAFLVLGLGQDLLAGELAKPKGPVILTVAGQISNPNRRDVPEEDAVFLGNRDKIPELAAEFDLAMLESFGLQEIEIGYRGWPGPPTRVAGPALRDVLTAAGATGRKFILVSLNDVRSEVSREDIERLNWIVGVKRDGRYFSIGQRGPVWLVYNYPDGRELTEEDDKRWRWGVYFIEVQ